MNAKRKGTRNEHRSRGIPITAAEIATALAGHRSGERWVAHCPAHADSTPSLSMAERDGRILLHCHAGCNQSTVIAALRDRGLWPGVTRRVAPRTERDDVPSRAPDHVWPYVDATGAVVRRTARWDLPGGGKRVRPQVPDGRGGWSVGEMRGARPLCRLSELLARPDAPVLVVEGEPAADAAQDVLSDYIATTSAGGSGAAARTDWAAVRGRRVTVWPDADAPGARYAADVVQLARAAGAAEVRVVDLPEDLPAGWDLADRLPPTWTVDTVRELIERARPPADAAPSVGRRARLVCVADVAPKAVEWLWLPRLARGKLTLLAGDPGAGKTHLALAVAAGLSRGWPLPGQVTSGPPCSIVYMSREDGVADTLRPRLDALRADCSRVHVLDGAADGGSVSLANVDVIVDAIERTGAALVVVDPIQSWLGARVDAHRANETRPVLDALAAVCARHRCACLVIAHTAKARGVRAVTAALGSIDFAAAARVMLIAGADPHDESRSVLAAAKSNIGPMPDSVAYAIDRETGAFSWAGTVDVTAADVLAADGATEDDRSALSEAIDWLRTELAAGPRTARDMERAARAAGIAGHTLRRARRAAGVRARRQGFGRGGAWLWQLADAIGGIDPQTGSTGAYDAYGDVEEGAA
jgi:hypothetical protein